MAIQFSLQQMHIYLNGASTFTPAVPSYTEFTALFDQWQIRGVDLDIYWAKNSVDTVTAGHSGVALWHTTDYDDVATATVAEMQQYPGVRLTSLAENGGSVLHHSFKPVVRLEAPAGGSTTYLPQLESPQWIDCTYPNTDHRGVKIYLETFDRFANYDMGSILVVAKISFAFKNVR